MTAIDCVEYEKGSTVLVERDALHSRRSRSEAKAFVQGVWDLMPRSDEPNANGEQLADVRRNIRSGNISAAQTAIDRCSCDDAESLNLRGIVSELQRDFRSAERAYKAAVARDPLCSAAKFNLRRCYELWTFGRSDVLLCL